MTYLTWQTLLSHEKNQPYFRDIIEKVKQEQSQNKNIYPASQNIFNAFRLTEFKHIKVVILGQDPYHGPNQAHGLCFSVPEGVAIPPSLQNIFKEIHADLGLPIPKTGCLENWARQGVLLLNASLTVEAHKPQSHGQFGWEKFTDKVISLVSENLEGVVFLLWGAYAQRKANLIDANKHCILTAPHPSPLSAHRGFLGCKHFSKANAYLRKVGKAEIDWRV